VGAIVVVLVVVIVLLARGSIENYNNIKLKTSKAGRRRKLVGSKSSMSAAYAKHCWHEIVLVKGVPESMTVLKEKQASFYLSVVKPE
jgi:hypothetical protein